MMNDIYPRNAVIDGTEWPKTVVLSPNELPPYVA